RIVSPGLPAATAAASWAVVWTAMVDAARALPPRKSAIETTATAATNVAPKRRTPARLLILFRLLSKSPPGRGAKRVCHRFFACLPYAGRSNPAAAVCPAISPNGHELET